MKKDIERIGIFILIVSLLFCSMPKEEEKIVMASTRDEMQPKNVKQNENLFSQLNKEDYIDGEAIILYKATGQVSAKKATSNFGEGITVDETVEFGENKVSSKVTTQKTEGTQSIYVSKVSSKTLSTEKLLGQLQKQSNIVYAEPNYVIKPCSLEANSEYRDYQWQLNNQEQNNGRKGCDVNPEFAWDKSLGEDQVVALLDTGVDYTHEELKGNMWINPYPGALIGTYGYDFIDDDNDPMDELGHGTHCAGIIAGSGKKVTGIAPRAKIMALKVTDADEYGSMMLAVEAYQYIYRALELGINIVAINCPWKIRVRSYLLEEIVNLIGEKGAITVNAAGNLEDSDDSRYYQWDTPSDFRIGVASSTESDELAPYSYDGDLAAPGNNILSTDRNNVYNPTINRDNKGYSEYYDEFTKPIDTSYMKIIQPEQGGYVWVNQVDGVNFGLKDPKGRALSISIEAYKPGKYGIYLPITLPKSKTNYFVSAAIQYERRETRYEDYCNPYRLSGEAGISSRNEIMKINERKDEEIGEKNNFTISGWDVISLDSGKKVANGDSDGIWIAFNIDQCGFYKISIDNVGISKKDKKPSEFGKYSFRSGTSMSSSIVAGAVALLSATHPDMGAAELRELVLHSVRKVNSMEGRRITGGILDLSKSTLNTAPVLESIRMEENRIIIQGDYFGKEGGTVKIAGEQIEPKSWSESKVTIPIMEFKGEKVVVELTRKDGLSTNKELTLIPDNPAVKWMNDLDEIYGGSIATDGKELYYINENLEFYKYNSERKLQLETLKPELFSMEGQEILSEEFGMKVLLESELVYADESFYGIATCATKYYRSAFLVRYDVKKNKWYKETDISKEMQNITQVTLANYQDKLYIIGGYDSVEKKAVGTVYTLEYKKDNSKLVKQPEMIPARFASVARVLKDKLIVTMGKDDYDSVPSNIVYDGSKWVEDNTLKPEESDDIYYYKSLIGVYEGNLIYICREKNFPYEKIVIYNYEEKKIKTENYNIKGVELSGGNYFFGTIVDNQYMLLNAWLKVEFTDDFKAVARYDGSLIILDLEKLILGE